MSGAYRPLPELLRRPGWGGVLSNSAKSAAEPDPRVYAAGVEATGADPSEVVMVAAHWWDLLGASRAGLAPAWVGPEERVLMPGVEVDWRGPDLAATAAAVAAG